MTNQPAAVLSPETLLEASKEHPILLFDGVCNLCNNSVQWVIRHDAREQFRFAALQSDTGQALLRATGAPHESIDSVVLIENGRFLQRSDAALALLRRIGGAWSMMYGFRAFPRFLRDGVYNWIARNRYRWFGKQESCMMPTPELRRRFVG